MTDWNKVNKIRIHNWNETMKHLVLKAIAAKILFDAGYQVYTEHDFKNNLTEEMKVADVYAESGNRVKDRIIVEVETKPTKKHNADLMNFYQNETLYIIDVRQISDNIVEMEDQVRHILGM